MKKNISKQAKKASKLAKAENLKKKLEQFITVKNAEGDPDTTAEILIQNKIDYTPKVSVIIPVYNVEPYLRECLDSVLNQTLKEIEVICVDDGSTDKSLDILKEYAKKDKRMTVIRQQNLHAGVARNAGLSQAKGEYLSFLDSDDFFELNMLEEIYDKSKQNDDDIFIYNYDFYDNAMNSYKESYKYNSRYLQQEGFSAKDYPKYIYFLATPNAWTKLFKRTLIINNSIYFENCSSCNDITFVDTALSVAERINVSNNVYVHYRINSGVNISNNREVKAFSIIHAMKKLKSNLERLKVYKIFRENFEKQLVVRAKSEILKADTVFKTKFLAEFKNIFADDLYNELLKELEVKVSVIIPIYNAEKYLRECLDSVVNQTLKNIEIICVNDCSTDGSLEIIKEYASKDGRIIIVNNDKNTGAPGAVKNIGMQHASGEYIGFVDSDDYVDLNYFEVLYKEAIKQNADISSINSILKFSDNEQIQVKLDTKGKMVLITPKDKTPLMRKSSTNWARIYKRRLLEKYHLKCYDKFSTAEDNLFSMEVMSVANKIVMVPNITYYYRQYDGSVTGRKRTKEHFNIFDIYLMIDKFISKTFSGEEKNLYLTAVNERKKLDFKWFLNSLDINYLQEFKEKLLNVFPLVYKHLFLHEIPIILASDDNYAPFMYTTMVSILENAKETTYYDFYLMVPSAFSKNNEKTILTLKDIYNCDIHFIDMKDAFSDLTMRIAHITSPTYYRLLAGDLLPKEYGKCIYLDVDICVCQDLSELYNIDMGNNYIAGVVAAGYYFSEAANCKRLNLPSMKTYVNAGVLLMNLKQIRQDKMTEKFVELSKKNYSSQDQDVVNVACYGKIITLPPKYNAMITRLQQNDPRLRDLYAEEDIWEANISPCIIHYANKNKPWNSNFVYMEQYWWNIARKTPYINKVFKKDISLLKNLLELDYLHRTKSLLNLDNPQTFNEKIQWLKLYASTPIKTRLADKYLVRDWVKEKIGEEYLIPLLGIYDRFEDIDFDKLPNQFVIKCNHGCAYNIIVRDKSLLDLQDTKTKLDKWIRENFASKAGCELHYRDIKPKIIIEKFIENKHSDELNDYKFYCFDGKVKYIQVISERIRNTHKVSFYDTNWKKQTWWDNVFYEGKVEKPHKFAEMLQIVDKLCKGFNFVRVDLYYLDTGEIYFGEMTFTPGSGSMRWSSEKINEYLGSLIKLPKLAYNIDTGEYYKLPKTSKIKPYLLFPYYALRLPKLKKKYLDTFAKKLPSVLTEFRVDIKNIGKAINAVGVAAAKATITQPSWATNASGIGQVVSGETRKQKINIKAINSGKLTLNFRGQDKRDENKTRIPLWCDYKSIKIDGKKINDKTVQTWHDQPFKYEMPVKDGQEVQLEIEQAYHKYTKTELKNLLLKLNASSHYVVQNIDKLTDAVYKNIYPVASKSAKDKQLSFKHFLYHKVKIDSYTKTYICGIRVKKKPANIYEFIDKRIEALSKNWEGKFAAVVNSGAVNKKELLTKMTSLNTACQKELKATGTSLKQDIAALAKENSLIKSNSLYMIKSLNDKMAEVMGGQTVAAETLQVIQAENTAEILASMAKIIAAQATAQDALQQSDNANRTAILDELTKLPESLTKKSEANKAEILAHVTKMTETANANRTAILDELAKLPESMSKNSAANKAEILANVTQMTETANANRTAILDELTKLPENLTKKSEVNKAEIIESINAVTQKQQSRIDNLLNSLKQYYVSRTKTDNYSLEFRTFADMADCIRKNLKKIPENVDLVVGIPRSGMIPAYIIALFMNKKCCSLDEFLAGSTGSNGNRKMDTSEINNILVIDDSVYNGTEMGRTREKLAPLADKYHFTYATVYVKPDSEDKVDVWMERVSAPRVWQWNYLNHSIARKACFDMDGVLCVDPTPEENDDGEKYLEFISKTKPLYIPTYEINTIVTSRLEKYRQPTEQWLKEHNVQYKQLIMLDLPTAEERRKLGCHAKFKAEVYKNLADTVLFVESEPNQAREIALLTGKTVICTSTDEVY